jgi:hypothetical protein
MGLCKDSCAIVIGKLGLANQRNFIWNYYPENTKILWMDDDISDILTIDKQSLENLSDFVEEAFQTCEKENCRLWGIYPVSNPFFMKHGYTTDLRFIVGCFYGTIKKGKNPDDRDLSFKEDSYRSCSYYVADGKVVRYSWLAPVTHFSTTPGGLQETRSRDQELHGAQYVADIFPSLAKLYFRKRNNCPELRLKDRS